MFQDAHQLADCYLTKLAQHQGLSLFKHVVLMASLQVSGPNSDGVRADCLDCHHVVFAGCYSNSTHCVAQFKRQV